MATPILNQNGPFTITILIPTDNGVDIHRTNCNGFILTEGPQALAEERFHIQWFDLLRNQQENYYVKSYSVSRHGRRYTVVNEFEFSFIFDRMMKAPLT